MLSLSELFEGCGSADWGLHAFAARLELTRLGQEERQGNTTVKSTVHHLWYSVSLTFNNVMLQQWVILHTVG